jgi:hypothetical protein
MFSCLDDWSDKASESDSTPDEGVGPNEDGSSEGASATSKPKKQAKPSNVAAKRKNHLNIVFIGHVGMYYYGHQSVWFYFVGLFESMQSRQECVRSRGSLMSGNERLNLNTIRRGEMFHLAPLI